MHEAREIRRAFRQADRLVVATDDGVAAGRLIESCLRRLQIVGLERRLSRLEYVLGSARYLKERAVLLNPSGDVLVYRKGSSGYVELGRHEEHLAAGNVVTHNHPSLPLGGSPMLSPVDVDYALKHGFKNMRSVSRGRTFSLTLGDGVEDSSVKSLLNTIYRRIAARGSIFYVRMVARAVQESSLDVSAEVIRNRRRPRQALTQ